MNNLEMLTDESVADDAVISEISGKNSPWMQNKKEHWSGVVKRLKKRENGGT